MVDAYFSTLMEDSDGSENEFMPLLREDWKQVMRDNRLSSKNLLLSFSSHFFVYGCCRVI